MMQLTTIFLERNFIFLGISFQFTKINKFIIKFPLVIYVTLNLSGLFYITNFMINNIYL